MATWSLHGCSAPNAEQRPSGAIDPFLDTLEELTFRWFWDESHPESGLTAGRAPSRPFSSIAAIGFALTAYGAGVERGWVTREEARARTLTTLRTLWTLPQGSDSAGVAGYRGYFYHFLDLDTGFRWRDNELSSIDTALLMAGVLFAREYFDEPHPDEARIRGLADSLYRRVEWPFFQGDRPPGITMGWRPERGFGRAQWIGYNEAIILLVLALGSPTHPVTAEAWDAWVGGYDDRERWGTFYGYEFLNFAPLFGHQYSHIWIDFRGIQDAYMRGKGIDYFENSRRATYAQRAYAQGNPMGWRGYGADVWGLTACAGPGRFDVNIDGQERQFYAYRARGAGLDGVHDDGTIPPAAAAGSIAFAPEIVTPALKTMRQRYGEHLFGPYGFKDGFNATLVALPSGVELQHGRVVPGVGWFADDYLSTDQGPIVLMIENYRSGMIWERMKRSPYVVRGLCRAGFRGGWLDCT